MRFRSAIFIALVGAGVVYSLLNSSDTARGPSTDTVSGLVTHVRDGDTIEVDNIAIRLNGLTCDERRSALGKQATQTMQKLVSGQRLRCSLNGEQTYDREVGRCTLPDGRDIGEIMISSGLCGRCDQYDPTGSYIAAQRAAGTFKGSFPKYCQTH